MFLFEKSLIGAYWIRLYELEQEILTGGIHSRVVVTKYWGCGPAYG